MTPVATYARVAVATRTGRAQLARQECRLARAVASWPGCAHHVAAYSDIGPALAWRPALAQLIANASFGRFQVVIVENLDRPALDASQLRPLLTRLGAFGVRAYPLSSPLRRHVLRLLTLLVGPNSPTTFLGVGERGLWRRRSTLVHPGRAASASSRCDLQGRATTPGVATVLAPLAQSRSRRGQPRAGHQAPPVPFVRRNGPSSKRSSMARLWPTCRSVPTPPVAKPQSFVPKQHRISWRQPKENQPRSLCPDCERRPRGPLNLSQQVA